MTELILSIAAAITALGIIFAFGKSMVKKTRAFKEKADSALDAINGRPEIVNPETGKVLLEAAPSIMHRVALIEEVQLQMAQSMNTIAETNDRIIQVEQSVMEAIDGFNEEKERGHAEIWEAISKLSQAKD